MENILPPTSFQGRVCLERSLVMQCSCAAYLGISLACSWVHCWRRSINFCGKAKKSTRRPCWNFKLAKTGKEIELLSLLTINTLKRLQKLYRLNKNSAKASSCWAILSRNMIYKIFFKDILNNYRTNQPVFSQ
jgi:hypothetical protein